MMWLPTWTLLKREILRFWSVFGQTVMAPVLTASLYFLIFGVSLGKQISVNSGVSYLNFVVPGLIMMSVLQNAFANSSSSLFMAKFLGYIVEFQAAPLSPGSFMIAYTVSSIVRGLIVGSVVFIVSLFFTSLPWANIPIALAMMFVGSFLFAQLGIIAAIFSKTFDHLSVATNFVLQPLIYLGGVFYSIDVLPPFWQKVSHFNPLFYMIDGFRSGVLGVSDVAPSLSLMMTVAFSVVSFGISYLMLKKGYKIRQ